MEQHGRLEFLGRPWSERVLIEIAYGYEKATKHRSPSAYPAATQLLQHAVVRHTTE